MRLGLLSYRTTLHMGGAGGGLCAELSQREEQPNPQT